MLASTTARFAVVLVVLAVTVNAITVEDVYKKLLERERSSGNAFAAQFIRPIGRVGDELVSYCAPHLYPTSLDLI